MLVVVFDNETIPEKGKVTLNINQSFDIKLTAEEARRQVNRWVLNEVSYLMRALEPTLVIGETIVWRVPISLGFPHTGQVGQVGVVDVNIATGKMNNTPNCKAKIEQCAEKMVAHLPPYKQRQETPSAYLAKNVPPAPKLKLTKDNQSKLTTVE